jgi:hypothetical protein
MAKNENISKIWYLSRVDKKYLGDNLFLTMRAKRQRREYMKSSFYHDKIEGVQKMKGYIVLDEREDISTTSDFDEIGQLVLYNGEPYVYTKALTYKKLIVAN